MSLALDTSSWRAVPFGEVVANINDYFSAANDGVLPYVAGPHIVGGEPTVASYGSTSDDDFPPTFKRKFEAGDVLLHSRGIEKLAAVDRAGVTGEKLFVLRTMDESRLLQSFLPWLLMGATAQQHMKDNFTGSVNRFLNWRPLASLVIDLPPIGEQKRIADLLWATESHRVALGELIACLRDGMTQLIRGLPRHLGNARTVRDVATVRNGQNYPKVMQDDRSGDVPFFKVADLDRAGNSRFLTNPGGWVTAADVQALAAEVLPAGTIVTARVGAAIRLERRRALASPGLVDENHLVIRPFAIDAAYLLAVLAETKLARSGNAGVVPSLNQQIVGAVPLPALSEDDELRVGQTYRLLGDAIEIADSECARVQSFRRAALDSFFGGN